MSSASIVRIGTGREHLHERDHVTARPAERPVAEGGDQAADGDDDEPCADDLPPAVAAAVSPVEEDRPSGRFEMKTAASTASSIAADDRRAFLRLTHD